MLSRQAALQTHIVHDRRLACGCAVPAQRRRAQHRVLARAEKETTPKQKEVPGLGLKAAWAAAEQYGNLVGGKREAQTPADQKVRDAPRIPHPSAQACMHAHVRSKHEIQLDIIPTLTSESRRSTSAERMQLQASGRIMRPTTLSAARASWPLMTRAASSGTILQRSTALVRRTGPTSNHMHVHLQCEILRCQMYLIMFGCRAIQEQCQQPRRAHVSRQEICTHEAYHIDLKHTDLKHILC